MSGGQGEGHGAGNRRVSNIPGFPCERPGCPRERAVWYVRIRVGKCSVSRGCEERKKERKREIRGFPHFLKEAFFMSD